MKINSKTFLIALCGVGMLLTTACQKEEPIKKPSSLVVKPNLVQLKAGTKDTTYVVKNGIPPYKAYSSDELIATAIGQDSMIIITGHRKGTVELFIEDKNKIGNTIVVRVLPSALKLDFDKYEVALKVGRESTVEIKSGVPPYKVTQGKEHVVKTTIEGKHIHLEGTGTGYAEITIADAEGHDGVIAVMVQ